MALVAHDFALFPSVVAAIGIAANPTLPLILYIDGGVSHDPVPNDAFCQTNLGTIGHTADQPLCNRRNKLQTGVFRGINRHLLGRTLTFL